MSRKLLTGILEISPVLKMLASSRATRLIHGLYVGMRYVNMSTWLKASPLAGFLVCKSCSVVMSIIGLVMKYVHSFYKKLLVEAKLV